LSLLFALLFVSHITWEKTKKLLWTLLPATLILSLPLLFIHSVESYHDLPLVLYAILVVYFLFVYLKEQEYESLLMAVLLTCIMASIKIEGLIIYAAAACICFLFFLRQQKQLQKLFQCILQKKQLILLLAVVCLFFLPFQIVRMAHDL
jgi:TRAP-type C4-dicarboxylate transport system permease large subunit